MMKKNEKNEKCLLKNSQQYKSITMILKYTSFDNYENHTSI